jgi:peptidyl-prolyl cis-trans isomerase B (cyclophilin B)
MATATIELTGGTVVIDLDRAGTPCTVGSFVHLANAGYFNDTPCHRLTASATLSVLQCGDPSGTGSGGPGYRYPDETDSDMVYPAGTVAMANSGPDTNGSQFFLVYEDSTLPPDYTVFGTMTQGLDVIQDIAAEGITGSGNATKPVQPVTISTVTATG